MKKYSDIKLKNLKSKIISGVMWLETLLAIFMIASVLLSSKDLISFIVQIFTLDAIPSYDMFQKFLSHLLLLVIALELALMLVKHTPNSVVEVMLYAIARKMLVYGSSALEIFLGVLSLAGIFFIKKYLFSERDKKLEEKESFVQELSVDIIKKTNVISNKTTE
ncbi:hypothetical protein HYH96_05105 [Clostridium botulinum]|uniref:Membrane protein n=4 Tax=Clostridium TaxID=1485 RepID=A5I1J8_CLOBH|nr:MULTISPECIES: hypothetical protein [Clostridium]ABS35677.1 conserved hypothetical protein [Clostridium botulinum A str. ATCC 19397]ABS37952.1 conserved hypothetical protein [Clostridium botulinum A str. Hall]ABS40642.1 conserved hypothetical protein [Clostridium botulinum F str. Langeland]ADF99178.1 conserved hypothetical protein [Clostridium botulinum F str. 230613]APH22369.1 hypothetical protein NPD1_2753 [Clostridium botulinum]